MSEESKLIIYSTPDGRTDIQLHIEHGTIWLSQLEIAELFATTKQNVSLHVQNILEEGELQETATVKESLTVRMETVAQNRCDQFGGKRRTPEGLEKRRRSCPKNPENER
ncbi:MAG TPA: hypothetical protein VIT91_05560 [Chthoniobacterales bacterium]